MFQKGHRKNNTATSFQAYEIRATGEQVCQRCSISSFEKWATGEDCILHCKLSKTVCHLVLWGGCTHTLGRLNSHMSTWPKTIGTNSSGQGSAVYIYLKDKEHSFKEENVRSVEREDWWFDRDVNEWWFAVRLEKPSLNARITAASPNNEWCTL